jgi:predicted PurR-regulated permease PerM
MDRALASSPLIWVGIILATCLLLVLFQSLLWLVMPILLAIIFYYILSPWVNLAMARGMSRARAVFIVTMLLCLFLVAVGAIVYPKISRAAQNGATNIQDYITTGTSLIDKAKQTLGKHHVPFLSITPPHSLGAVAIDAPAVTEQDDFSHKVGDYVNKHASDFLSWIPSLLLVPYMTYFFLLDGPRFKRFLIQAIPNAFFEKALYLFYRVENQLHRYFQGLMTLTALDAACLGVGLWFLGLNSPFFLATLAAVMAWLPYIGSITGGLMVVLISAHDAPENTWLPYEVAILFIVVRLLDDFIFMPMTVGRSLHMHPLVTVLMILLGGAVAGISGLLLVMPVLGVVMVAGQIIGELLADARILARYRHARELRRQRARADLYAE